MTDADDKKAAFLAALGAALENETFVKLTLGKFRGKGEPRKSVATRIVLKGVPHLKLVTSLPRRDETKNYPLPAAISHVESLLGGSYLSATLFSTERDMTLSYSKKQKPHLATGKPTFSAPEPATHDREKAYLVPAVRPYLKELRVSDAEGRVKPAMQGKYRQICRFIEIVDASLNEAGMRSVAQPVSIVDIGAGKGYLTFALYDHLANTLGLSCRMTGVEVRSDLVEFCNGLARKLDFSGLKFDATEARSTDVASADIVIALHACDTATDDAMALGIATDAKLIFAAPCCQHELAPQLKDTGAGLYGLTKYPLFKQRQADLVTDAARALLLEASGYQVKIVEFVSTEHTSKNILIAAMKSQNTDRDLARRQYRELKRATGFSTQHLESQLKDVE